MEQRCLDIDPDLVPHLASKPNPSPTGFERTAKKLLFQRFEKVPYQNINSIDERDNWTTFG